MHCTVLVIVLQVASALLGSRHAAVRSRLFAVKSPRQVLGQQLAEGAVPILAALFAPVAAKAAQKFYLTEPTQEFKDEVAKTNANKSERQKNRKRWDALLERLEKAATPGDLEAVLKDMKSYLEEGMVPPDFNKLDLVKMCRLKKMLNPENKRSKKTKPEWTTPVEIAYQALILEYNKQLQPNNKSEDML